jgi:hypothetical protein
MANETETSDTGVAVNDAYTGLLAISLIALLVGSLLLFLDYSQHSGNPPKSPGTPTGIPKMEAPKPAEKPAVPEKKEEGKEAPKEGKEAAPK